MSGYLNKATLIGNLGQDPDVRTTQSDGKIVTLSIATSESWKDKRTGERVERTEWHRVVIFNEALADLAGQYLAKGAKVYVEGQIRTRKWQDQSGADRYSTEIHLTPFNGEIKFLDSRKSADRPSDGNGVAREPAMAGGGGRAPGGGDLDDEIPFAVCWQ